MQGLTELIFRKAYYTLYPASFDYAVSPFLSITHGKIRNAWKKVDDVDIAENANSIPVVPQLLGYEPEGFVELTNLLEEMGYGEVNWNLGCPMRRVAAKHRGSGMLPYPDEVKRTLDYVIPRINAALSVKIRLGYNSSDEIDRIIPILNDYPIANLTVHPRIGRQQYSGVPDLDKLRAILPSIKTRVIYNGDICTVGDYRRIRTLFPEIKDVMIGRGTLYNPLLPMQIREAFPDDFNSPAGGVQSTPQQFIRLLTTTIYERNLSCQAKTRKMKEYWCLVSKSIPGTEQYKRKVLYATDLEEIRTLIFEMTK